MAAPESAKCAHPPCNCMTKPGDNYCSQICKDAGSRPRSKSDASVGTNLAPCLMSNRHGRRAGADLSQCLVAITRRTMPFGESATE